MHNHTKVKSVKKFLIVRFSSIGDIVLTSPIIRCVKSQIPDCEVHFLTKASYRSILVPNPHIDKLFTIQKNISECLDELKEENYSHIIDLHNNLRSNQLLRKLRKPSGQLDKVNVRKWIMVNLKMNFLPAKHIVDRYFETVKGIGVYNDMRGLEFHIDKKDEVKKVEGFDIKIPYIALVLSGTYVTKQIPTDKIISIIEGLDIPVALIGGSDEQEMADIVSEKSRVPVRNFAGKMNIGQSADLIRKSALVITPDTGMMHIAAAFDKKIISIWGNTIAEFGMYPYLTRKNRNLKIAEQDIIQVMNLSCRPCTKLGKSSCPKGHFKCMNDIDTKSIVELANRRLS